jgi:hypothetical protein
MGDLAEAISELVLDLGETSVKESGVGHYRVKKGHPHLVERVLDPGKVLGEVLNNLKKSHQVACRFRNSSPRRVSI